MRARGTQGGVTLVSLLVATALAAFLLLVVVELFLAGRKALAWQEAAARVEAAGERALALLAAELRMAGFTAMGPVPAAAPAAAPDCAGAARWPMAPPALAFADRAGNDGVMLSDGATVACLPVAHLAPGSDLLAVKRSASVATVSRGMPGPRAVRETQWYLGVDSAGGHGFTYLGADADADALASADVSWWEWHARIFYLRSYAVARGDGVPTLCVERLMGAGMRSECLVEGVERLHLEFGLDSDGDGRAETWRARPTAAELALARRVRIYLLLRSVRPLPGRSDAVTIALGAEQLSLPAGPRYIRRVFTRSVPLRNRAGAA